MSERFEEYYVRKTADSPDLSLMPEEWAAKVRSSAQNAFFLLERSSGYVDIAANRCEAIAKSIGEAIYIAVQENTCSFHYEHWKDEKRLRVLSYNADYSWHKVFGTAEAWECGTFFSEDIFQRNIDCFNESRDEIEMAWQRKCFQEGDRFPAIHETEAYRGVTGWIEKMTGVCLS